MPASADGMLLLLLLLVGMAPSTHSTAITASRSRDAIKTHDCPLLSQHQSPHQACHCTASPELEIHTLHQRCTGTWRMEAVHFGAPFCLLFPTRTLSCSLLTHSLSFSRVCQRPTN
uniref:Putative secreted protein n=1 Tax=Anopheles darlingi TaxID=43151 RepID=A0A2M4DE09_ANODA